MTMKYLQEHKQGNMIQKALVFHLNLTFVAQKQVSTFQVCYIQ